MENQVNFDCKRNNDKTPLDANDDDADLQLSTSSSCCGELCDFITFPFLRDDPSWDQPTDSGTTTCSPHSKTRSNHKKTKKRKTKHPHQKQWRDDDDDDGGSGKSVPTRSRSNTDPPTPEKLPLCSPATVRAVSVVQKQQQHPNTTGATPAPPPPSFHHSIQTGSSSIHTFDQHHYTNNDEDNDEDSHTSDDIVSVEDEEDEEDHADSTTTPQIIQPMVDRSLLDNWEAHWEERLAERQQAVDAEARKVAAAAQEQQGETVTPTTLVDNGKLGLPPTNHNYNLSVVVEETSSRLWSEAEDESLSVDRSQDRFANDEAAECRTNERLLLVSVGGCKDSDGEAKNRSVNDVNSFSIEDRDLKKEPRLESAPSEFQQEQPHSVEEERAFVSSSSDSSLSFQHCHSTHDPRGSFVTTDEKDDDDDETPIEVPLANAPTMEFSDLLPDEKLVSNAAGTSANQESDTEGVATDNDTVVDEQQSMGNRLVSVNNPNLMLHEQGELDDPWSIETKGFIASKVASDDASSVIPEEEAASNTPIKSDIILPNEEVEENSYIDEVELQSECSSCSDPYLSAEECIDEAQLSTGEGADDQAEHQFELGDCKQLENVTGAAARAYPSLDSHSVSSADPTMKSDETLSLDHVDNVIDSRMETLARQQSREVIESGQSAVRSAQRSTVEMDTELLSVDKDQSRPRDLIPSESASTIAETNQPNDALLMKAHNRTFNEVDDDLERKFQLTKSFEDEVNWSDSSADVESISVLPVEEGLSKPNDAISSEVESINAETDPCEEEWLIEEQSRTLDETDDCWDRNIQVSNLVGGNTNWSESGVARVEYISAVPVEEDQSGPRDAIRADAKSTFAGTEQADEDQLFMEHILSSDEMSNDTLHKRIEATKAVPATGEQSKPRDATHAEATSIVAETNQLDEDLLIEEHNGSIDEADAFEIAIQMTKSYGDEEYLCHYVADVGSITDVPVEEDSSVANCWKDDSFAAQGVNTDAATGTVASLSDSACGKTSSSIPDAEGNNWCLMDEYFLADSPEVAADTLDRVVQECCERLVDPVMSSNNASIMTTELSCRPNVVNDAADSVANPCDSEDVFHDSMAYDESLDDESEEEDWIRADNSDFCDVEGFRNEFGPFFDEDNSAGHVAEDEDLFDEALSDNTEGCSMDPFDCELELVDGRVQSRQNWFNSDESSSHQGLEKGAADCDQSIVPNEWYSHPTVEDNTIAGFARLASDKEVMLDVNAVKESLDEVMAEEDSTEDESRVSSISYFGDANDELLTPNDMSCFEDVHLNSLGASKSESPAKLTEYASWTAAAGETLIDPEHQIYCYQTVDEACVFHGKAPSHESITQAAFDSQDEGIKSASAEADGCNVPVGLSSSDSTECTRKTRSVELARGLVGTGGAQFSEFVREDTEHEAAYKIIFDRMLRNNLADNETIYKPARSNPLLENAQQRMDLSLESSHNEDEIPSLYGADKEPVEKMGLINCAIAPTTDLSLFHLGDLNDTIDATSRCVDSAVNAQHRSLDTMALVGVHAGWTILENSDENPSVVLLDNFNDPVENTVFDLGTEECSATASTVKREGRDDAYLLKESVDDLSFGKHVGLLEEPISVSEDDPFVVSEDPIDVTSVGEEDMIFDESSHTRQRLSSYTEEASTLTPCDNSFIQENREDKTTIVPTGFPKWTNVFSTKDTVVIITEDEDSFGCQMDQTPQGLDVNAENARNESDKAYVPTNACACIVNNETGSMTRESVVFLGDINGSLDIAPARYDQSVDKSAEHRLTNDASSKVATSKLPLLLSSLTPMCADLSPPIDEVVTTYPYQGRQRQQKMVDAVYNSRFCGVISREMGFTTPNLDSVQPFSMSSPFGRNPFVVEDDDNDDIQSVPGVPLVEKFDSDLKEEATQIIRESRSVDSADVLSVRSELEKYFPGLMTEVEEQEALCLSKKKFQLALAELKQHFVAKRKPFNNLILLGTLTVIFSLLKLNSWIHEMTHDDGFLELRLRIIDYEV